MNVIDSIFAESTDPIEEIISKANLDTLDYIPLASTVSGVARAYLGVLQTTLGIARFPTQLKERIAGHNQEFTFLQGIANIVRGVIATRCFIGNIVLYLYDSLQTQQKKGDFK